MNLDETLRTIVRAEMRAALREELPELLRGAVSARAYDECGADMYLSTGKAAKLAGVRAEAIRSWVNTGKLKGHHAGSRLRLRRDELEAFLAREADAAQGRVDLDEMARDIVAGRIGRAKGGS